MNLLALFFLVIVQTGSPAAKPDLSTPEKSVQAFVSSYYKLDLETANACVYGTKPNPTKMAAFKETIPKTRAQFKDKVNISLENPKAEIKGDTATVTVTVVAGAGSS